MLLDAYARSDRDPLSRVVASLSDDLPMRLRTFANETIQLRREFQENAQRMLSERDPQLSARYAAWITKHAHEVAYRWSSLMRTVERWARYDPGPGIVLRVGPVPEVER